VCIKSGDRIHFAQVIMEFRLDDAAHSTVLKVFAGRKKKGTQDSKGTELIEREDLDSTLSQ